MRAPPHGRSQDGVIGIEVSVIMVNHYRTLHGHLGMKILMTETAGTVVQTMMIPGEETKATIGIVRDMIITTAEVIMTTTNLEIVMIGVEIIIVEMNVNMRMLMAIVASTATGGLTQGHGLALGNAVTLEDTVGNAISRACVLW